MSFSVRSVLIFALCALALPSCKPRTTQENQVSPDLITNPVTASGKKPTSELPVMEFDFDHHDFGTVIQGEKLSVVFNFTNTGGADLVISQVSSTCGCTVPSWSTKPVKPGDRGSIEVVFNSAGKTGTVHKSINILANTQPNTVQLEISAEVFVPTSKK